jgi:hypothetical protein
MSSAVKRNRASGSKREREQRTDTEEAAATMRRSKRKSLGEYIVDDDELGDEV